MQPILQCLLQCLSYHSQSIGAYLNVHLKADLIHAVYSVFTPAKVDEERALARQPMRASDVLFGDIDSIKVLLHILIQLFADVEKVGIESSRYRKYIVGIIRLLWDNPHCAQTVQELKNEESTVMMFAQSLIASFSKLTDDAFTAIPEIKALTAEMLTPEFAQLEESERDSKQLRLSQLETSVQFSFDLTDETLELLLRAAQPWKVGVSLMYDSSGGVDGPLHHEVPLHHAAPSDRAARQSGGRCLANGKPREIPLR